MQRQIDTSDATAGPSVFWLGFGALLSGLGTVLLGPILPHVTQMWALTDAQGGVLLFAKFVGAFLGGATVPRKLRYGILLGTLLAGSGFVGFGFSKGVALGSVALFFGGIGLGQLIASTNILAGRRYRNHTGSALSSLNFFWSLGAVGCGVLVAFSLPRISLYELLVWIASAFLVVGLGGLAQKRRARATGVEAEDLTSELPRRVLVAFGILLFLYGGLETCLTAWLTTYTLRYSTGAKLLAGQSGTVLLWTALTAGRAIASVALRLAAEKLVQRIGLVLSFVFIGALAATQNAGRMSLWCILLGLSLAPFFPATFGLFMRRKPAPRAAGLVLAVSGLGAAAFPWLMGVISTRTGSLRTAMAVPLALVVLLLLASLLNFEPAHGGPLPQMFKGEYSEKTGV